MSTRYDAIVVGLGTMGSATAYQLAKRGLRTLGLEQFEIPHGKGANHGYSRVIRQAYFEHPDYVPLLKRAYELWHQIEAESAQKMLHITGALYLGTPGCETLAGTLLAGRTYKLPVHELSRKDVLDRYPHLVIPQDHVGLWEEPAGFVVPEKSITAHCLAALQYGAELHGHEGVTSWTSDANGVTVTTPLATYRAEKIVFCGGAWSDRLITDLGIPLTVTRQVLGWIWPKKPELYQPGKWPVWVVDYPGPGGGNYYGFPMMPDNPGFKVALHKRAMVVNPDKVVREPLPGDEETFRPVVRQFMPDADGPTLAIRACLYTNSPDFHFILDTHPKHPRVSLACGFSGHGFKFATVVGEAMADLAQFDKTKLPIGFLGLKRFGVRG